MNVSERGKSRIAVIGTKFLSSFQSPDYRLYFGGAIAQFAAMSMQIVTGPLLMYRLTDSPALLGTMSLVNAVPMITVSMIGGAVADRAQKKRIIVLCMLASALIALATGLLLFTGYISSNNTGSWWFLILSSFIMGCVMGMMMPSLQAIIPEIVSTDKLMNAVALNSFGTNILNLFAPGIAGFMIDAYNFHTVYFATSGCYTCSALIFSFMHNPNITVKSGGNVIEEIRRGFQYIRGHSLILIVLVFTLVFVVLSMPYQQLLPIFVDDILKVGATGMGLLMSVTGAGALITAVIMALLPNKKRGLLILMAGLISGIALVIFSFSTVWALSLSVIIFVGVGQTLRWTIGNALVQAYAEPEYRGRVMSIMAMQWGFMSICTFVAGILADIVPVQAVLGSLASMLVLFSFLAMIFFRQIRKLN
jgi:MFS family permease